MDLELGTVASATRGAQILADLQARHGFLDAEQERTAPACIMSMLALVTERLGQIRRVVRNEENPAHLRAPHNAVEAPDTSGEFLGDIVLRSWESHRQHLVMLGTQKMEPPRNTKRTPKHRGGRERRVAPASSEVPQGAIQSEPAPSEPASNEPRRQSG
ncbi:hypothetical protein BHS06_24570 [Myxococcus xanthus]|nr:hypothetical protein BHS06_24570 [Myxococcus xanthus]